MSRKKPKGKGRNYKAEYARRIARAKKLGIPKSVARGHAPKNVAGMRAAKFLGVKPGTILRDVRKPRPIVVESYPSGTFSDEEFERIATQIGLKESLYDQLRNRIREDSERAFGGERPVRQSGETLDEYEERLRDTQVIDTELPWGNEEAFIAMMEELGLNVPEGYQQYTSPGAK